MPSIQSEKIEFPGHDGSPLSARLDRAPGEPRAFAVFAHCFTCSKDIAAARRISGGLAERGISVLRFDFTGLGHSDGEFANTNFSSNIEDLIAACRHLEAEFEGPQLLVGHSLGGAAVLAAAHQIPSARAVATIGAPADPAHVRELLSEATPEIEAAGEACVTLAGRQFRIRKQFLDDIDAQGQRERIAELGRALLVFHAPRDQTVGIENATSIFVAAKHPKSFVSLDHADHLLTREQDAAFVADVLSSWAQRYLEPPRQPPLEVAPGEAVVHDNAGYPYAQSVRVGPHALWSDEPLHVGGNDLGPTPYGLLAAALGSCTSMTLRMYADRKGFPLESVTTRVRHEKVHARDCEECETSEGRIDVLHREIELVGDLDEETRARLMNIADKCPVHRSLRAEIVVLTKERD
jgi:putative redox protein